MRPLREVGRGLPRYVERDFARYLECGALAYGFARVHCERCKDELLVAFLLVLLQGRERTAREFEALLGGVGWALERITPTPSGMSLLEAGKR